MAFNRFWSSGVLFNGFSGCNLKYRPGIKFILRHYPPSLLPSLSAILPLSSSPSPSSLSPSLLLLQTFIQPYLHQAPFEALEIHG